MKITYKINTDSSKSIEKNTDLAAVFLDTARSMASNYK